MDVQRRKGEEKVVDFSQMGTSGKAIENKNLGR